jgi:hypothetical protein
MMWLGRPTKESAMMVLSPVKAMMRLARARYAYLLVEKGDQEGDRILDECFLWRSR